MEFTASQIAEGKTTEERIAYLEAKVFELIEANNTLIANFTAANELGK